MLTSIQINHTSQAVVTTYYIRQRYSKFLRLTCNFKIFATIFFSKAKFWEHTKFYIHKISCPMVVLSPIRWMCRVIIHHLYHNCIIILLIHKPLSLGPAALGVCISKIPHSCGITITYTGVISLIRSTKISATDMGILDPCWYHMKMLLIFL